MPSEPKKNSIARANQNFDPLRSSKPALRNENDEGAPVGMAKERIQKVLARAGIGSRRAIEAMIGEGRVLVNKERVTRQGLKIDIEKDIVHVDGAKVHLVAVEAQERLYYLLHKPRKVMSTTKDPANRTTVIDLLGPLADLRLFPVGRLDYESEGAMLLTNDGALSHQLMHPSLKVPKRYEVKMKGRPSDEVLAKLEKGLYLEDGPAKAFDVERLREVESNTWVAMTLKEGRNRLIRRMCWRVKHPVVRLIRTGIGPITLDGLQVGEYRELTSEEISALSTRV